MAHRFFSDAPDEGESGFRYFIPAGFQSPSGDFYQDPLNFNRYLIRHSSATFCTRVRGEGLPGARITSGDLLVVDRGITPDHGHIAVLRHRGTYLLRRLLRQGERWLLSTDTPGETLTPMSEEYVIWGVVTHGIVHHLPSTPVSVRALHDG